MFEDRDGMIYVTRFIFCSYMEANSTHRWEENGTGLSYRYVQHIEIKLLECQEWLECLEQNVVALNCDERYNCLGKCIETENVYRQKRYRQKNYRR